jgi:16S rRNA (guanine1207-N2)-methyltransferase
MEVSARQIARLEALVASRQPGEIGLAVDWMPTDRASWRVWNRYTSGPVGATPWPDAVEVRFAVVALQKVRAATDMALFAAAACLPQGSPVYLFGQNDLGIRSFSRLGESEFETLDAAAHGRILCTIRPETVRHDTLAAFRTTRVLELPHAGVHPFASYPGCFADGRLDPGTSLLLESLPERPAGTRVFDFACGIGVIARTVRALWPEAVVQGSDHDALAILAARENVSGAEFLVADGPSAMGSFRPDLVLSNPPFHRGKARLDEQWQSLITVSRESLAAGGELRLVVQREVMAEPALLAAFGNARRVAAAGGYVVWSARKPSNEAGRPASKRSERA